MGCDALICVLIIEKRGVGFLIDIAHVRIHCFIAGNELINQKRRRQNNYADGDKDPERFMMQFHNDLQPCKSDTSVYHTAYIRSNATGKDILK